MLDIHLSSNHRNIDYEDDEGEQLGLRQAEMRKK